MRPSLPHGAGPDGRDARPHTPAPTPNPQRFISASELGEYAYCRRAWWLRAVQGVTTREQGSRFQSGHAAHERHGSSLLLARALAIAAVAALLIAALLVFLERVR